MEEKLKELDAQFDGTYSWWSKVYDPSSGGAYYCLSGKQARSDGETGFGPDIEATQKLVYVCNQEGILGDRRLKAFREGIIRYLNDRQDRESGFFVDPEYEKDYTLKTLSRAEAMARDTLALCGGKPLYKPSHERISTNRAARNHYADFESVDSFHAWMDSLPWDDNIWTAGAAFRSRLGAFLSLTPPMDGLIMDRMQSFLDEKQCDDGYFGLSPDGDHWWSRLSGTLKIIALYRSLNLPVPRAAKLKETLLLDLRNRRYDNLIVLFNTVNSLNILTSYGHSLDDRQKLMVLDRSVSVFQDFRTADGAFPTFRERPCPTEMGKTFGKPVREGNTNATGLAHMTRQDLYVLLAGPGAMPSHPHSDDLLKGLNEQARVWSYE